MNMSDLVLTAGREAASFEPGQLVRIRRGVALRLPPGAVGAPRWEIVSAVGQARILATQATAKLPLVFTNESALLLMGIDGWVQNPDVLVRCDGRKMPQTLPAVQVGKTVVPGVERRQSWARAPLPPRRCRGVMVDDPAVVAVHFAATSHPLEAVVALSGLMRLMVLEACGGRASREAIAAQAPQVRARLHGLVEGLSYVPDRRRAHQLINAADPGCESLGERVVLYVLSTLTGAPVVCQQSVEAGGRSYFVDLAVPHLRLAIEFDGVSKLGSTDRELRESRYAWVERQAAIVNAGWRVVRYRWEDLRDLSALRSALVRDGALGDDVAGAHTSLWIPPGKAELERWGR